MNKAAHSFEGNFHFLLRHTLTPLAATRSASYSEAQSERKSHQIVKSRGCVLIRLNVIKVRSYLLGVSRSLRGHILIIISASLPGWLRKRALIRDLIKI